MVVVVGSLQVAGIVGVLQMGVGGVEWCYIRKVRVLELLLNLNSIE